MSIPYELTGRTQQKARTRNSLISAARELLAEGLTPTVERTADRAAISRTTAFRYFPNQRAMLLATYPQLGELSLMGPGAPEDPMARLEAVTQEFTRQVLAYEPELRAQLHLALEPGPSRQDALPLRQGRGIGWIEDALAPLRQTLPGRELRRLVLAIRATLGIEALVWLTDVAGVSREEAVDIMRSSARTLLRSAIADAAPAKN
ncbi:MAG: TetR/AcrR family transcriptional regulator [Candidatus Dormibacteraeota bacterium]|nr:TetR/AcrR family transcriptional regulator [Candidatus Dormibacteraeota bacterium]